MPEAAERKPGCGEQSAAHKEPSLRNALTGLGNQAIAGSACIAPPTLDDLEA